MSTGGPFSVLTLPGILGVRSLIDLGRDPLALLLRGVDHDVTRIRLGKQTAFLLNHPDLVRRVLVDRVDAHDKRTANNKVFRLVFGESLVTTDGDHWKRQRRIAAPAFHHQRIQSFAETMRDSVAGTLERWGRLPEGTIVDFDAAMFALTLDVVCRCLIGHESTDELASVLSRELPQVFDYGAFKMPRPWYPGVWAPTQRNRRFLRSRDAVRSAIERIIAQRRERQLVRTDLLDMLMSAVDEETGERMSDAELRDEVITIVLAGYETSTNMLDWTFYALAKDPTVRERLEEELDRVLGDRPVTFADLPSLVYTEAVLKESLRMYPPAWIMVRRALEDDDFIGRPTPAGTLFLLSPYVSHRRAEYFPEPEAFRPERFLEGEPPRFAYYPFGGGRRTCIGNGFAIVEAKIFLAEIARRFRFEVARGCRVEPEARVMLKPREGLSMTIHSRGRGEGRR